MSFNAFAIYSSLYSDPADYHWTDSNDDMGITGEEEPVESFTPTDARPSESQCYIKVVPHPSSGLEPTFIPLDSPTGSPPDSIDNDPPTASPAGDDPTSTLNPYAPFRSQADFEFTEFAISHRLSRDAVNDLLKIVDTEFLS